MIPISLSKRLSSVKEGEDEDGEGNSLNSTPTSEVGGTEKLLDERYIAHCIMFM